MIPTLALLLWTATVPKLGSNAWHGPTGWHELVPYKDGEAHLERSRIHEAIATCRQHDWQGYVQWSSAIGRETDSCEFIRKVSRYLLGPNGRVEYTWGVYLSPFAERNTMSVFALWIALIAVAICAIHAHHRLDQIAKKDRKP